MFLLMVGCSLLDVTWAMAVGPNKRSASVGGDQFQSPKRRSRSTEGSPSTDRSRAGYSLRADGIKRPAGRVKPPKWEREGDDLYAEFKSNGVAVSLEDAQIMLANLAPNGTECSNGRRRTTTGSIQNDLHVNPDKPDDKNKEKPPPPIGTMWGSLSVGPVLRSRLVERAGLLYPTAVQEAAFDVILKGQNAVIASATGTGKSLSYLIPLLSRFGIQTPAIVFIITPTVELALQLQRELDDRLGYSEGRSQPTAMQVIGGPSDRDGSDEDVMLLSSIGNAPFLAGTPKTFRQLLAEAKRSTNNKQLSQIAQTILCNPKCIVLDEADRLLQTEQVARDAATKKQEQFKSTRFGTSRRGLTPSQTELLFRELLPNPGRQVVCASATVGRTLRKQIMTLVGAPSVEKASVLVTADDRTKKDAALRRASWVPSGISHLYRLIPPDESDMKRNSDDNDEAGHEVTINALWGTMQQLQPKTALVFPGRAGVVRVKEMLQDRGLKDVRTLRDDKATIQNTDTNETMIPNTDITHNGWVGTTIHIVGEKFARGLDLPGVDYVFMVAPPSSAAGYAHLAGRTGRNNRPGVVVMLVRPKEASKVVAIAEALGLSFSPVTADA